MGRPRRSSVQKYHDRVAPRYDLSYDDAFWKWHDELTWDYIKPHLPADLSVPVLDLGCGTGKWGAKLLQSGYAVTFVDISIRMVDQARKRVAAGAKAERASFLQADLVDLSELPAESFGFAVAMGDPIGCSSHPPRAMKEIRRVMQHNGILAATFDNRFAALDYYLQQGDPNLLLRFLRDGKTHWLTKDADERFPIHTYGPKDIEKLLEQSHFTPIEMLGKTVLPMRSYRELLETSALRRKWATVEKRLARDQQAMTRASHLQVTARAV